MRKKSRCNEKKDWDTRPISGVAVHCLRALPSVFIAGGLLNLLLGMIALGGEGYTEVGIRARNKTSIANVLLLSMEHVYNYFPLGRLYVVKITCWICAKDVSDSE